MEKYFFQRNFGKTRKEKSHVLKTTPKNLFFFEKQHSFFFNLASQKQILIFSSEIGFSFLIRSILDMCRICTYHFLFCLPSLLTVQCQHLNSSRYPFLQLLVVYPLVMLTWPVSPLSLGLLQRNKNQAWNQAIVMSYNIPQENLKAKTGSREISGLL